MYYKILSLFYLVGIKCENHTGAIILLKEIFGIDNSIIDNAKIERIDKQYYTNPVTVLEAETFLINCEEFLDNLDAFIDGMTSKESYLNKFTSSYR